MAPTIVGNATRVRYFAGQTLTSQDFQVEQDYGRAKRRLQNQLLLGAGVVSGLEVGIDTASSDDAPVVLVAPGLAIAPDGEALAVAQPLTCLLSTTLASGFVTLAYAERSTNPVPAAGPGGEPQDSRIEEGVAVDFDGGIREGCVAIARLVRETGGWQVDPEFRPATSKRRA